MTKVAETKERQLLEAEEFIQNYVKYFSKDDLYSRYVTYKAPNVEDILAIRDELKQRYDRMENGRVNCWYRSQNKDFMYLSIGTEPSYPFANSYKIYVPITQSTARKSLISIFDYL